MATEYSLLTWAGLGTTVTFTDAGDIVSFTAHGAPNGHAFRFTGSGTPPAAFTKNTVTYYLRQGADANKFTVYPTQADATAGTNQITFTGTGSGTNQVVGEYWAALDTAGRTRYGTAGSERVYATYEAFAIFMASYSGKSLDLEWILEVQGKWLDPSYTNQDCSTGYKKCTVHSKINGVREQSSFHHGIVGGGYQNLFNVNGRSGINLTPPGSVIDGIECRNLDTVNAGSVNAGQQGQITNCIIHSTAAINAGVVACNIVIGNGTTSNSDGIGEANFTYGIVAFNLITNCKRGFNFSSATDSRIPNTVYLGNVSIGNGTNWPVTNCQGRAGTRFRASYNFGDSTDIKTVTFENSATPGTLTCRLTGHTFSINTPIRFKNGGGGATAPGNIAFSTLYYIKAVATDTFTLAATVGGTAIAYSSSGSGTITTSLVWDTSDTVGYVATTDFIDYANKNFKPTLVTSPQVELITLTDGDGLPRYDITDALRPSYKAASFPNNKATAGPFEFDHGEGLAPISVTFIDIEDGSTIRVFTTGTTTELASTTNSSGDFLASGASGTVDYTIYKDGYVPIRKSGVVLYDGIVISETQSVARGYVASSGLTYGTTATINTATKIFTLPTPTTGQNWYSFWCEQFRTHADLRNKEFPLRDNGPNSFSLRLGYEFDGSTSIANLSRDGIRYVDPSEVQTAVWSALLSVGVPSGARVRYQQTDGGTTVNAVVTSGNIDELIQVYGDATHGNFDKRGYLVCKVQEQGYDQVETDVVAQYGALEDQLYVIGLAPLPNSIATGNPSLANPPTITDHAGSPVTWNSKDFSITIEDSAAGNTGANIMKWLRYYFETGGTFQGKDAFNWHDLVQQNGSDFKSVHGKIYGDTGATLKGVRVIQNGTTDPHNDFTLFTADDGTTYAPPVVAAAEAAILADSRVQLFNVTTDTEIDNTFVAGTSYSYTITTEASIGDTLRLNVCKLGRQSTPAFAVWSASGVTFLVDQPEETIYTSWGIDGSTVTEFALDITGTVEIDANDVDGATLKTRLGAWYNYVLTTENGIRYLYGALTFLAANAIRINVDVLDLQIENINATTALRFTDLDVRLFRSDGSSIIAPTSYSIHNDYTGVPDVSIVTISGESVITGDITDVAAEVQTALTAQGYTVTRAPKLDNLDAPVSGGSGGLTEAEHNQLMNTLTVPKFIGLK